ncbi:MAG: TonB-dependent receptor [Novosphingobium sp.]|nr:TonB-dependent receptor [Novosphingobium sp.]
MKSMLRASSALTIAGLSLILGAAPAMAQDAPADASDETAPADIVVTAQKRKEKLQDVPAAVSVVSADALQRLSTNNVEDTQRLVPTLTFVKGTTNLNSGLFLRGIGTVNFSIAAEPSVSTVLDGVVLARAGEAFGDLYDLERIEVLRGPQGTLFGKNSSAGVVSVITKEPGEDLSGYVEAGYFDRNEFKVKGSVGGPIGAGWKAGVTAFYSKYDGNIYNRTRSEWVNGYEHYGVRGQLIGEISPDFRIKLLADYRKSDDVCCSFVPAAPNPTNPVPAAITAVLAPLQGADTRINVAEANNRTIEDTWGTSLQADLSLGDHTLTSITSYRKWNNREIRDGSWIDQVYVGTPLIRDDGPQRSSTFTQELRLASPTGGFVDYVVGAFYYRAVARRTFTRSDTYCTASLDPLLPSGLRPCTLPGATILNPVGSATFGSVFNNFAVFGQATWHLGSNVRLVTGLRYTYDKVETDHKRVTNFVGTTFPGVGAPAGIAAAFDQGVYDFALANGGAFGGSNGQPWRGETSANNLSGKAALEFDVTKDNMAYASYSRGYKGPAFNTFFNMQYFNVAPIAPELSDSYEVGLKNSFWNGKAIVNLAAYYVKVRNYQSNFPTTVNNAVTTTIINAGDVSSRGFEVDWLIRPMRRFTISGGVSYSIARVDLFRDPPAAQIGNAITPGTPLAFAPKFKGTLGVAYTVEPSGLPFGIEFSGQASFTDKQISQLQATNSLNQVLTRNAVTIPAYEQVDLSVAFVGEDNRYRVAFIVKNLFDTAFASTIGTGGPGGTVLYQIPRDADRYWGVTARINF